MSHDAFEGDNAHSVEVTFESLELLAHYLRSHVARSATGVLGVLRVHLDGDSEIGESEVTLEVED
jgi:hypothetical protein